MAWLAAWSVVNVVVSVEVSACGPAPKPPVQVMVLGLSGTSMETRQVELTSIANLTNLRGGVLSMTGANRVTIDPNDPLQSQGIDNMTDTQRFEVLVKDKGVEPRGHFIDRGGVYWPGDFHTWNMVTTYFNFETAYGYFADLYGEQDPLLKDIRGLRLMYFPEFRLLSADPLTDNALYYSPLQAFMILPFKTQQRIPFAMNMGIIGHEFSHRVFNSRVYGGVGIPEVWKAGNLASLNNRWTGLPINLLRAFDEGLADYHGYAVTCRDPIGGCRPNFLNLSLEDQQYASQRDVGRTNACLTSTLKSALESTPPDEWVRSTAMYVYGNIWATALLQGGLAAGQEGAMRQGLMKAMNNGSKPYNDIARLVSQNASSGQNFTVEALANTIVENISDTPPNQSELKRQLCNQLITRLAIDCNNGGMGPCRPGVEFMKACPSTSARQNFCKYPPE